MTTPIGRSPSPNLPPSSAKGPQAAPPTPTCPPRPLISSGWPRGACRGMISSCGRRPSWALLRAASRARSGCGRNGRQRPTAKPRSSSGPGRSGRSPFCRGDRVKALPGSHSPLRARNAEKECVRCPCRLYLVVHITVILVVPASPSTVKTMTSLPNPTAGSVHESEAVQQAGPDTDELVDIDGIRALFKLGRTAAYQLTHRSGFPPPVQVSRRCLRWWSSEVHAYARTLQRERARRRGVAMTTQQVAEPTAQPRRITGTVRPARRRSQPG